MTALTFQEYVPLALKTAKRRGSNRLDVMHAAIGMLTEIGELATVVKRVAIYGKEVTAEMRENVTEEVGDVCWYIALAVSVWGFAPHQISKMDAMWERIYEDPDGHDPEDLIASLSTLPAAIYSVADWADSGDFRPSSLSKVFDSLSDALPQLAALLLWARTGKTLEMALGQNIDKLLTGKKARYASGAYSDEQAEARLDKGGVDATAS